MPTTDAQLTSRTTDLTKYWYDLFEAYKGELGIREVFDGDRRLIAETPTIAIMAGPKQRELYGASMMTTVSHTVVFMLYHKRLTTVEISEREVQTLAEDVEEFIHVNKFAEGRVQVGLVTSVEPGYADRDGTIIRTTRLVWEGQARSLI